MLLDVCSPRAVSITWPERAWQSLRGDGHQVFIPSNHVLFLLVFNYASTMSSTGFCMMEFGLLSDRSYLDTFAVLTCAGSSSLQHHDTCGTLTMCTYDRALKTDYKCWLTLPCTQTQHAIQCSLQSHI